MSLVSPLFTTPRNVSNSFKISRPEVFCKNGVLTNFAKFTGKYLRGTLDFDKCAGLIPTTLSKKKTPTQRVFL